MWPEAAVPAYVRFEPGALRWLTDLAADVRVPLLVGVPDAETDGTQVRYLNSAFLVESAGVRARYDKMHLVPFGEYVPLKRLLFFVEAIAAEIGDFTPGRQVAILPLEGAPFGTVICYEVIFPDLFRRFVAEGASFMTNITNDAWFGDSGGPAAASRDGAAPRGREPDRDRARRQHRGLRVRAPVGRDPEHAPARDARDAPGRRAAPPGAHVLHPVRRRLRLRLRRAHGRRPPGRRRRGSPGLAPC